MSNWPDSVNATSTALAKLDAALTGELANGTSERRALKILETQICIYKFEIEVYALLASLINSEES